MRSGSCEHVVATMDCKSARRGQGTASSVTLCCQVNQTCDITTLHTLHILRSNHRAPGICTVQGQCVNVKLRTAAGLLTCTATLPASGAARLCVVTKASPAMMLAVTSLSPSTAYRVTFCVPRFDTS
jgi:hypothetical protein